MKTKTKLFLLSGILAGAAVVAGVVSQLPSAPSVVYSGTYTNGLVVSQDNALVDGADIANVGGGICLEITGNNVTVRNSFIHDCKDHGVRFLGTNGGLFEDNEVTRAAMRYAPNTISSGWPSLLKVQSVDESPTGLSQNIIIRGNYIHNGYGECMGLRGSYITVEDNTVADCYSVAIYSNSDHLTVKNNFVVCRDSAYFRGGAPAVGIGSAEETFSGWGAHGHVAPVVINNIVTGCKYGYSYGTSSSSNGLVDAVIAYNTFDRTTNASIRLTYYSNQSNITVHNNIISKASSFNSSGVSNAGNVFFTFANNLQSSDFMLTSPLPASGSYQVATDFGGRTRVSPLDAGAWDYIGGGITVTPRPPTATASPSATPPPVSTATPECIYFSGHRQEVCLK